MGAEETAYAVALFNRGEREYNTIVLPGVELVIPLEEDVDCDPFQDDEIRLSEIGGGAERIVKSSDAAAVPNHEERLIYYHFADVLPGLYRLSVRIGGQWVELANDIVVTPRGAYAGRRRLGGAPSKVAFDTREAPRLVPETSEPAGSARWLPKHMDQNPNRWDREGRR